MPCPAVAIAQGLLAEGAIIQAFDPAAMDNARAVLGDQVTYCEDAYAACVDVDVAVIATEWNQFRNLDLGRLRATMRAPVVVDLRNVYEPARMRELEFDYTSVGRQV